MGPAFQVHQFHRQESEEAPALKHYVWEKRGQTAHEVFLTKQSELIQDNESVKAHRRANGKASVFELDLGMLLLLSRFSRVRLCETP